MVWAAFGFGGKVNIVFLSCQINALSYQNLLEENLLPFTEATSYLQVEDRCMFRGCVYQQAN